MIESNQTKKKILIIGVVVLMTILACIVVVKEFIGNEGNNGGPTPTPTSNIEVSDDFTTNIVKVINKDNTNNYLISPYNIELALNMLRDGADGKTKEEIDKVIGNRTINDISVKDKVGIANGVFIRDKYKNNVKDDYYNIVKTKYNSDIIYDSFKTPDKINNWVKEKTNDMIPSILDSMDERFVMGLASALAIDVKWSNQFDCSSTKSEEFTKVNDEKINVEMMHKTYKDGAKYIKTEDAEGIVIPYQKEENSNVELEFIGLLPNDTVSNYVNSLTKEKIDNIINNEKDATEKFHINLSLPRFKYDYQPLDFIKVLNTLGIKEAFNPDLANFKKMVEIEDDNVYVGEAIHKTHIELNEKGTKAAAVTYFGMYAKGSIEPPKEFEEVNVIFNKPFVYMIREKNTGEILFFGTVYEPTLWTKTTCDNN